MIGAHPTRWEAIMRKAVCGLTLMAALLPAWAGLTGAAAAGERKGTALLNELRMGGYVVYLRHATTNKTKPDANPINVHDCSTQRALSQEGRTMARQIGQAFAANGVRVDRVLSSPYCRTAETGALAFPKAKREAVRWLHYSLVLPKAEAASAASRLKVELGVKPQRGTNTVIVGHTSNLKEAAGIWPNKEGQAVVFRPSGNGEFQFVGVIDPQDLEKHGS
jgi:phosphohistidine phosphatase SixA